MTEVNPLSFAIYCKIFFFSATSTHIPNHFPTLLCLAYKSPKLTNYRESSMASESRQTTSYTSTYFTPRAASPNLRPRTSGRPRTRPRTATSTVAGDQQVICAISESRSVSPVVGLAFVNLSTAEASLCQISDNQTYERTVQKLQVFEPTEILIAQNTFNQTSRLASTLESQLGARVTPLKRNHWSETVGEEYIQQLAFKEDVEAIQFSVSGNFYAVCCLAAVCVHSNTNSASTTSASTHQVTLWVLSLTP